MNKLDILRVAMLIATLTIASCLGPCDAKQDCEKRGGKWRPFKGEVTCGGADWLDDCAPKYEGVCYYGDAER